MTETAQILIVDDNPHNLKMVSKLLENQGYQILLATNGLEAMKIVGNNHIDIILLDIMMPDMNGFEVCEQLKQNDATKEIPVIFLTAKNESDDIVKGFQMGGVDYITKPFQKEELLARLNNHIKLKFTHDLLKKYAEQYKNTRNSMMSILLDLGKIID